MTSVNLQYLTLRQQKREERKQIYICLYKVHGLRFKFSTRDARSNDKILADIIAYPCKKS